jgi:hypothetical protein
MNKYLAADDNRIIHKKYIRWVKKINDIMEVCCKFNGCKVGVDTIKVSKQKNPQSYSVLETMFQETQETQEMHQKPQSLLKDPTQETQK